MKNLLLIFLAVSGYITAIGQYAANDYIKAKMAFRQNRLDSSIYYINNARQYFTGRQNFDSLALTLALEAQVIWEKETLASAMAKHAPLYKCYRTGSG